ncbi:MAG TPA: hypothetical protein PLP19_16540 [bacterium]|nr:hypothetical protein [bacterium]HPN45102.1 hypothetical protein [bacterium]
MPQVKIGHVVRQENKTRGNSPLFQGKKPWPISQRQDVNPGAIKMLTRWTAWTAYHLPDRSSGSPVASPFGTY